MGLLDDAFEWVDRNVFGGILPGGFTGGVGLPGAGLVERVAGQFAPGPQLPSGFVPTPQAAVPIVPQVGGGLFAGPAAAQAAAGMPVVAAMPAAAPRGKLITATARVVNGQIIPIRMVPGRSLVTTEDLRTVKRVRKTMRLLNRAFPKPPKKRRRLSAPRRSHTHAKK